MNKKRAKELLPIIEAFSNGKKIEYSENNSIWYSASTPSWDDKRFYRIKPEPKLVPFTFEDNLLFRDKWIRSKSDKFPGMLKIISYNEVNVHTEFSAIGYKYLLDEYVFDGNEPCGKLINE